MSEKEPVFVQQSNTGALKAFLETVAAQYYGNNRPLMQFCRESSVVSIYAEDLLEDLNRLAQYYAGISQTRVGIVGANSYPWMANALAVILTGKQLILLDPNIRLEDMENLISYADVQLLVTSPEQYAALCTPAQTVPVMPMVPCEAEEHSGNWEQAYGAFCAAEPAQDGGFMCFTSGTSRSAKGVAINIRTLTVKAEVSKEDCIDVPGVRSFLPVPLYHIYGFTCTFYQWARGNTMCLGSSPRYFKREIELMDPHIAWLVPTLLQFLLERCTLPPSLRRVVSGGSPCREEIVKLAESLGMIYYNMYGLSETLGWAFSSTEDGAHEWMMPITDVRPVVSEKGELGIHVPYHMEGYYKRPEDTREVLDGDVIWTGDAVVVDELGRIRILGRVRDMIVLENGEKVNAGDKDADLMQLPHVKEAAVIGVNGALIALIVPEDPAYWEEITAALSAYNQQYSQIHRIKRAVMRTEPLPRTSVGKLRRYVLEEQYKKEK